MQSVQIHVRQVDERIPDFSKGFCGGKDFLNIISLHQDLKRESWEDGETDIPHQLVLLCSEDLLLGLVINKQRS